MLVPEQLDQIRCKAQLLKEEWTSEIDKGLNAIKPIIRNEFRPKGIFGFLADPLVSFGADKYLKSARKIADKQLKIAMDCAIEILKNEHFTNAIEQFFEKFREYDVLYKHAKKTHEKFEFIVNSLKEEFILRIKDTIRLLSAKPLDGKRGFSSVSEVYKSAYNNNPEEAKRIQEEQIAHIKERIDVVRYDNTLVNIPFGLRTKVFKILERGLRYTERSYVERLSYKFA